MSFTDIDHLLDSFESGLNEAQGSATKQSIEDSKKSIPETEMSKPATLKSGIPLPVSPELSRDRRNRSLVDSTGLASVFGDSMAPMNRPAIIKNAGPKGNPNISAALSANLSSTSANDPSRTNLETVSSLPSTFSGARPRQNTTSDYLGLKSKADGLNSLNDSGRNSPTKDENPFLTSSKQRSTPSVFSNPTPRTPITTSKNISTTNSKLEQTVDTSDFFGNKPEFGTSAISKTFEKKTSLSSLPNVSTKNSDDTDNFRSPFENYGRGTSASSSNLKTLESKEIQAHDSSPWKQSDPKPKSQTLNRLPTEEPSSQKTNQTAADDPMDTFLSSLASIPLKKKVSGTTVKKNTTPTRKGRIEESATGEDDDEIENYGSRKNKLLIPTHLLDEDELKTMSSSVKSLYSNQLELLESSYKEQLLCLTQSHQRKEEILKDEIRTLQKDYEERIHKFKVEAQDNENATRSNNISSNNSSIKLQQEIQSLSEIVNQMKNFQTQTQSFINEQQSRQEQQQRFNHSANNELEIDKLATLFEKNVVPLIGKQMSLNNESLVHLFSETLNSHSTKGVSNYTKELEKFSIETQNKFTEILQKLIGLSSASNAYGGIDGKFEDFEKHLSSEFQKLVKLHKKHRNSIIKNILSSVTSSMETKMHENEHKKEQIKSQLKEFRKDFKRLLFEMEIKHEKIDKSQATLQSEQQKISQSLQNLNNWLQMTKTKQAASTMGLLDNNNTNIQPVNNDATTTGLSLQTEFELKLLREERHNFTQAVAHLNVERRKLNEERISFEQDKFKFEHDKNRVLELETMLKIKSDDLDEIKMRSDAARQDYSKLSTEFTRKLNNFEEDAAKQKETIEQIEQKFRKKEERLNYEKVELQREREFLEKLRNQMLCPSCLTTNTDPGSQFRSRGDGLELAAPISSSMSNLTQKSSTRLLQLPLSTTSSSTHMIDEGILIDREIKYLDEMYYKYFASKPPQQQ